MKKGRFILIIFICIGSAILQGSCPYGLNNSITELLNFNSRNHHIFTCKILKTFVRNYSFESIAVIKNIYKGSPKDTVYIYSGGGTTAGGEKLLPNSEWLIFSSTEDNLHYYATVCDYLSSPLKGGNNKECGRNDFTFGEIYIEVLNEYKSIKKNKFTGHKMIFGKGKLIAEGFFFNGLPQGKWTHFSRADEFSQMIKKSEINYDKGKLHGEYLIYHENEDKNVVVERRVYNSNSPISIDRIGGYAERYEYLEDLKRRKTWTYSDSLGKLLKQESFIEIDYESENYESISYRDGHYLNKTDSGSNEYYPLAEGNYSRGARIGEWKFYNIKGDLIRYENYPDSVKESSQFQIYDDDGKIKLSGLLIEAKRYGVWKYFNKGNMYCQEIYSNNGEKISQIYNYNSSRGLEYTPFVKSKKHGQKISYFTNGTIRSIENYANGNLNGLSIFFSEDGTIEKELNYINSRAFSLYQDENDLVYNNGFMSGQYVQFNLKTNKKSIEGELWNGYRIGIWIEYKEDGSYRKSYYSTDKQKVMNQCWYGWPILEEEYDKDGNLMTSSKY